MASFGFLYTMIVLYCLRTCEQQPARLRSLGIADIPDIGIRRGSVLAAA